MRKILVALIFTTLTLESGSQEKKLPLVFHEDFEKGASRWQPTDPSAWKIAEMAGSKRYHQHVQSKFKPPHRSPLNFSLVKDVVVTDFVLEAKCLSTGADVDHRDMCVFFGYQDSAHFYYAHLAKKGDDNANQIFIVNGKDRTKISKTTTAGTKWDGQWHDVKVVRDPGTGRIEIFFDDMKTPIMTAVDKTFGWGQVGIGSFDDTGMWDELKVYGVAYKKDK